jgi:hypothetical protein
MYPVLLGTESEISKAQRLVDSFRMRRARLESEIVHEKIQGASKPGAKSTEKRVFNNRWGISDVTVGGIVGGLAGVLVSLTALTTVLAGGM